MVLQLPVLNETYLFFLSECKYVAIDLAGHGLSSHRPPGVSYSFPYYVMDVRRVIDGVWVQEVVGHIWGDKEWTGVWQTSYIFTKFCW